MFYVVMLIVKSCLYYNEKVVPLNKIYLQYDNVLKSEYNIDNVFSVVGGLNNKVKFNGLYLYSFISLLTYTDNVLDYDIPFKKIFEFYNSKTLYIHHGHYKSRLNVYNDHDKVNNCSKQIMLYNEDKTISMITKSYDVGASIFENSHEKDIDITKSFDSVQDKNIKINHVLVPCINIVLKLTNNNIKALKKSYDNEIDKDGKCIYVPDNYCGYPKNRGSEIIYENLPKIYFNTPIILILNGTLVDSPTTDTPGVQVDAYPIQGLVNSTNIAKIINSPLQIGTLLDYTNKKHYYLYY